MFEISEEFNIEAGHKIFGYDGTSSKLKRVNWKIKITAKVKELNHKQMCLDYEEFQETLSKIVAKLHHHNLDKLEEFCYKNSTAETVARYIFQEASAKLNDENLEIKEVKIKNSYNRTIKYYHENNGSNDEDF